MSIDSVLNTSKVSLLSYQMAIGLTGANIANVNTPGYTRQAPVFQSVGVSDVSSLSSQIGINIVAVSRSYDKYLESQLVSEEQLLGYSEAQSDILQRIEGIFEEGSEGTSDLLNTFWNAWEELSADPGQQAARDSLMASAENLSAAFRRMDSELSQVMADTSDSIDDVVEDINHIITEIADLNNKIVGVAEDIGDANILKDSRMQLLKELSSSVNVSYVEDDTGTMNIFLAGGQPLVTGETFRLLSVEKSGNTIKDINYVDDHDKSLKTAVASGGKGKLTALLEFGDTIVPGYREKLDAFAAGLTSQVNLLHHQGYDAEGNPGGDFFAPATDAGSFRLNDEISSDLNRIAASATVNGDGENARLIGQIREAKVMSGGNATLNDYYTSIVGEVGRDVAEAKRDAAYRSSVMTQLNNRRESVSGVSLDEEMMNLIKYQMSYNSAAKLVGTVSEMIASLLKMVD